MCGIIGYVGKQSAAPILVEGLRRLEYRGYDSAGVAIMNPRGLQTRKKAGKIDEGLDKLLQVSPVPGVIGIGHTRWATHGVPSDQNSHPHLDQSQTVAIVHNGVIENFDLLKTRLQARGHVFLSETDTEVLAHLIGEHYEKNPKGTADRHPLVNAVIEALKEVIGTYGIAVISSKHPEMMVGARRGSPLIVGIGEHEHFLASDASAIVAHTQKVIYLNDYEVVSLEKDRFHIDSLGSTRPTYQISTIEFDAAAVEKGAYAHYMLKEIYEQPRTVENAMRGRIDLEESTAKFGGLNLNSGELRSIDHMIIAACGTSWHASLIGEHLFEELAHIPVEVEYASEFRYRHSPVEKNSLVLAITQSGETADTLASLREAKRRGHKVLSLCNVVGSTIAREADGGIYLHAGPEIGVASTKAFTSQVTALALMALFMGRMRMLTATRGAQILRALKDIPGQMEQILAMDDSIKKIAEKYAGSEDFFFLGRQYNFPVALEGALKLKEISYIHAEGYPSAEMKHGPIAMIDEKTPTVIITPSDGLYEKSVSNLEEIKARKGPIIAVATQGNQLLAKKVNDIIYVPPTLEPLFPLLAVLPLQLLAYHIAVLRGCDVDKPRNLAKSVTVE